MGKVTFNMTMSLDGFVAGPNDSPENGLGDGGEESMCGWCKDKFGLWWQIIPKQLGELMGDSDPEKSQSVVQAMLQMQKIVVADLQKAYDGK